MKKIALLLAGFLWINGLVWADVYQAQRQDWLKKAEAATPELHKTIEVWLNPYLIRMPIKIGVWRLSPD